MWIKDSRRRQEALVAFVFLFPTILILGTFNIYPAIYSLFLSFFEWDGFSIHKTMVGLANYYDLISSTDFWNSVRVTLLYASGVTVFATVLGLVTAILLNQNVSSSWLYRILCFMPVATPTVAIGVVWKYLLDPTQGAINKLLELVGISGPRWLTDPAWALPAVIGVGVWKRSGFNAIIYLAALQGIPESLMEAATVDGARPLQRFWYITRPLLRPATFSVIVTSIIESFQAFDLVYVMTEGGPLGSTDIIGYFLYRHGFRYSRLGYASAVAYVIFACVFIVTVIQFRISKRGGELA